MAELVPWALGLEVPRRDPTEIPPEGLLRKAEAADRANPAGSVSSAWHRVVGRACDARPRSLVPEHSTEVQRGVCPRLPEREERCADPSGVAA